MFLSNLLTNQKLRRITHLVLAWWILILGVVQGSSFFLETRPDFTFTQYETHSPSILTQTLAPLASFDGVHYLAIAQRGYIDEHRFLPLYPMLIKTLANPLQLFLPIQMSLLLAGTTLSLGSLIGAVYLLADFFPNIPLSKLGLTFLVFPTSFFFLGIYTESLFLFLVIISLISFTYKQIGSGGVISSLALITRLSGLALVPSALLAFAKQRKMLLTGCVFLPLAIYSWWNHQLHGDWLYFIHAHGQLGNSRAVETVVFPVVTLYRYLKILFTLSPSLHEWRVALLELLSTFTAIGLLIKAFRYQMPTHFHVFAWTAISIPLLSGTLTGMPRYMLTLIPIYIVLAHLPKKTWWSFAILSFCLQVVLVSLFTHGYFIA